MRPAATYRAARRNALKKRVAEIKAIADKDINTTDIPEAGEDFFKKAKVRARKQR